VIEQLGASTVHLVGHSFGGGVAAAVAMALGERAASVSLIAPIGMGDAIQADASRLEDRDP